jgi:ABC-type uncharacterized transport system involved in gliding motility auxiliary subunit
MAARTETRRNALLTVAAVLVGVVALNTVIDVLARSTRIDLTQDRLYSTSKGQLQKDVLRLIAPMQATVEDMYTRNSAGTASVTYCELKKQIMTQQAERIASAVLGRW